MASMELNKVNMDSVEQELTTFLSGDHLLRTTSQTRSTAQQGYITGDCKLFQKLTMLFWLLQTDVASKYLSDQFSIVQSKKHSKYNVGNILLHTIYLLITLNVTYRTDIKIFNSLTEKVTIADFLYRNGVPPECIDRIDFLYRAQLPSYNESRYTLITPEHSRRLLDESKEYPIPLVFGNIDPTINTLEMDHWFVLFNEKMFTVWGEGTFVVPFRVVPMMLEDGTDIFAKLIDSLKPGGLDKFRNALAYCFLYSEGSETLLNEYQDNYKKGFSFNIYELPKYNGETYAQTLIHICNDLLDSEDIISKLIPVNLGGGKKKLKHRRTRKIKHRRTRMRKHKKKTRRSLKNK